MKKLLIIIDRENWAFDTIAKNLIKYNKFDIRIYKKFSKDKNFENYLKKNYKNFDLIFFMHWSLAAKIISPLKYLNYNPLNTEIKYKLIIKKFGFLDYSKVIAGIHGHHDFDGLKSNPDKDIAPSKNLINFLNRFKMINCVSKRLYNLFKSNGLNNLVYTPNGVDSEKFYPTNELFKNKKLSVGCSGTLSRDAKEGISEFILPLKKYLGLNLKLLFLKEEIMSSQVICLIF